MIANQSILFVFNSLSAKVDLSFLKETFAGDDVNVINIQCNESDPIKYVDKILNSNDRAYSCKTYAILTSNKDFFKKAFPNNLIEFSKDDLSNQEKKDKLVNQIKWTFNGNKMKSNEKDPFLIGDLHFSHANIIKYCDRPWNSGKDSNGELIVTEKNVEQMNNDLINNWNSVVSNDDTVIVNGDFALGSKGRIPEYVYKLNGHKKLVLGNHDRFYMNSEMRSKYKDIVDFYLKAGFERVYDAPIILDNFIIISHEPVQWIRSKDVYANIYAHVHNQEFYKDYTCNTFCTSAERINYTPIRLSKIIDVWKSFQQ